MFRLADDAYTEPYDPPQYCPSDGCGVILDAWTKPEDHDVLCPHHVDHRPDLEELAAIEADEDVPVRHKGAA